jgi:cytochrome oxidase Cu insertion factor (SCO1/SenC/PrrC family)
MLIRTVLASIRHDKSGFQSMISPRHMATIAAAAFIAAASLAAGVALRHADEAHVTAADQSAVTYSLTDQNGQPVTQATYRGRWMLVFFGFTHCPDVCPMSMSYAADFLKSLGPDSKKLQVAFVTIDPERDTPAALKDYLANFDPRIVGLAGTPAQIAAAAKAFNVFYAKRPLEDLNDYMMDHSTAFYLVNPAGKLLRAFALQRGADEMTADLRETMSLPAEKTSP